MLLDCLKARQAPFRLRALRGPGFGGVGDRSLQVKSRSSFQNAAPRLSAKSRGPQPNRAKNASGGPAEEQEETSAIHTLQILVLAFLILGAAALKVQSSPAYTEFCRVGIYDGPGAEFVVITRSAEGHTYAFADGRTGRAGAAEAHVFCADGAVEVRGKGRWGARPLAVTDTVFRSDGIALAGRLIEPEAADEQTPLVVYAHGSEDTGWLDTARDPYQMVGRGVSVFVYDKRGTGRSEGDYTQNFPRLADDLVAASREAQGLARGRFGRFGLVALSQGGWVVPLAAERAGAEFIAVGYGLVVDIREEDAAQVARELQTAGYGEDVLSKARRITDATAHLATTLSEEALVAFEETRARYAGAPWLSQVRGDYTGLLLDATAEEIRTKILPVFQSYDVDWSLDPVAVLREVSVPQLWALAGADRQAPAEVTIERLTALRADGLDISLFVFPETDHGMWDVEERAGGGLRHTKVTDGFYDLMADWAHQRLGGVYGRAERR